MNYYGQMAIDFILHSRYFKNKKNGLFVECGAFNGVADSNTLFFYENLNWRGFNFEPIPSIYQQLIKNRPEDINLNLGLSDKDGTSVFTRVTDHSRFPQWDGDFANGSLKHTKDHKKQIEKNFPGSEYTDIEIKTISLKTFFEQKITKKPELFILDIEGHENTVLKQLKEIPEKKHPDVWCIEWGHDDVELTKNIMKENNYLLDYSDSINLIFKKEGLT